jgi:hypothetical protein
VERNETFELQAMRRYLELTLEDIKDAMVETSFDLHRLHEMRGSAKMLKDLIRALTRPVAAIPVVEKK